MDINSREIVLNFSEPIDPSSIDITGITILGMAGTTNPDLLYQLSSTSVFNVDSPTTVRIVLSDADFDAIQLRPDLATVESNTLLSMEPRTVTDHSNRHIMVEQISDSNPAMPSSFMRDTTPPEITSFTLDLDSNRMTLTYSEPVNVSSIFAHSLQISSHRNPNSEDISHNLTYSQLDAPTARVIGFNLSLTSTTFLKITPGIATGTEDTFLSAPTGIVHDIIGIPSNLLLSLSAYAVIADTSPPSVVRFGLDLNMGVLDIHFDDPVNVTTFRSSSVTLQSAPAQRPSQWYTLSQESNSSYSDNTIHQAVRVMLAESDLNEIKRIRLLCIDQHSCYMTVTASIAQDTSGLLSNAIPNGRGLIVTNFTDDETPPELVSWVLDMNRGQIIVTFSETMDITTLVYWRIYLYNGSYLLGQGTSFISFYELIPPDAASVFTIQLREYDINRIKRLPYVGTSVQDSYLHLFQEAILDMNSNSLLRSSLQASDVIPDTTPPSLIEFSLNVYTGVLRLSFDEIINISSINPSGLTLTEQTSMPNERYTLTGGTVSYTQNNEDAIQVNLNAADLTAINGNPYLANSRTTSYIVAAALSVQDMAQNQLNPILDDSALQAMYYVNSPIGIYFRYFIKYYYHEGQNTRATRVYVALDRRPATEVTFTVATEDGQAIGMFS